MDIERILKTRENAIYYGIGEYQKDCFGWVGGNAPACFDDKYLSNKDNLYFYLTFQNPLNPNKQISMFNQQQFTIGISVIFQCNIKSLSLLWI